MPGKIWFVGAGPGDPDLITVKGRALLEAAGAILYAARWSIRRPRATHRPAARSATRKT